MLIDVCMYFFHICSLNCIDNIKYVVYDIYNKIFFCRSFMAEMSIYVKQLGRSMLYLYSSKYKYNYCV